MITGTPGSYLGGAPPIEIPINGYDFIATPSKCRRYVPHPDIIYRGLDNLDISAGKSPAGVSDFLRWCQQPHRFKIGDCPDHLAQLGFHKWGAVGPLSMDRPSHPAIAVWLPFCWHTDGTIIHLQKNNFVDAPIVHFM